MYMEKLDTLFRRNPQNAENIISELKELVKYTNIAIEENLYLQARDAGCDIPDRKIMSLDIEKMRAHDKACMACERINEYAQDVGMRKIFDFELMENPYKNKPNAPYYDPDNHAKVAYFISVFINEYYKDASLELGPYSRTLDDVVFAKTDEVRNWNRINSEYDIPTKEYYEERLNNAPEKVKESVKYAESCDIKKIMENKESATFNLKNGIKVTVTKERDESSMFKDFMEGEKDESFLGTYKIEIESKQDLRKNVSILTPETRMGIDYDKENPCRMVGREIYPSQIQEIINNNMGFDKGSYEKFRDDLEK